MNKNLIPEVLKLLGVEYDERFKLTNTDGVITENDVFCFFEHGLSRALQDGEYEDASDILYDILAGNYEIVKLSWEPKEDEEYWTISFLKNQQPYAENYVWNGDDMDFTKLKLGMVYRTKAEAEAHFAEDYERLTGKPLSSR